MKYKDFSLRADKFNFAASHEQLKMIQGLVQKRFKSKRMTTARKEYCKQNNMKHDEDMFILSMYIHTAYELGRIDGETDLDAMFDSAFDALERNGQVKNKESLDAAKQVFNEFLEE